MERVKAYWRLFEEWATVYANKLRNNLFLKTQITFIGALFLICVVNIISLSLITNAVTEDTLDSIFSRWGTMLVEELPSPAFTILDLQAEIDETEQRYLTIIGAANVLVILLIGIIASRVVLIPTRDAISAQRNFIAHTAHELRTPLTVARTNLEVAQLDSENLTKSDYLKEFERTLTELDALAGIINNLVMLNTLTHLEPAEYHYYDLDEVIREVAQAYREFTERKSITLAVESEPGLLVWSNRNALKQMLGNLIGNAVNFSNEHGTVTVRAYQVSARYIRVTIADTGIGIAKEELPSIFKPFYRSPSLQEQHDSGSGLGLSIVRELVRLHHGRIKFQSELGVGTTATIDLPVIRRRLRLFSRDTKREETNEVAFDYASGKEKDQF